MAIKFRYSTDCSDNRIIRRIPSKGVKPAAPKYDYCFAENSEEHTEACSLGTRCQILIIVRHLVGEKSPDVKVKIWDWSTNFGENLGFLAP